MATTKSRKLRRSMISRVLTLYQDDPKTALQYCWATFGRQEFETTLGRFIWKNPIRTSLVVTIRALEKESYGQPSVLPKPGTVSVLPHAIR
jgi:hypothetical protein